MLSCVPLVLFCSIPRQLTSIFTNIPYLRHRHIFAATLYQLLDQHGSLFIAQWQRRRNRPKIERQIGLVRAFDVARYCSYGQFYERSSSKIKLRNKNTTIVKNVDFVKEATEFYQKICDSINETVSTKKGLKHITIQFWFCERPRYNTKCGSVRGMD